MSASGILAYTLRAGRFALGVLAIWTVFRMLLALRRRTDWRREVRLGTAVFYLAALTEIIALRGGSGDTRQLNLVPLGTTLSQLRGGIWPFVYHLGGNLAWFVPLGVLARRKCSLRQAILLGAAVSIILETLQYLLGTGVTDVDDVLINALGTGLGWWIFSNRRRVHS